MNSTTATNTIAFTISKKKGGYDPKEVDGFLEVVQANYKKMQDEYAALIEKYKTQSVMLNKANDNLIQQSAYYEAQIAQLRAQLETLETEGKNRPDSSARSKALIDAEALTKNMVDKAKSEAADINYEANQKIDKIMAELKKIKATVDSLSTGNIKMDSLSPINQEGTQQRQ